MRKDLPIVLEDYLDYMETIKGVSKNTVHEYFLDLRTFFRYYNLRHRLVEDTDDFNSIDIGNIDIDLIRKINIQDLHGYISYSDKIRANGNSAKSRKVASLRSFFQYLYRTVSLIDSNPAEGLEFPKARTRNPVYLSLDEAEALLNAVLDNKNPEYRYRDYAIITLFLNCGLRLSELSSINIDSIKSDRSLTIIGKGNKERVIYLNQACQDAIDAYLDYRPSDPKDRSALFISKQKNRMSNRAIQHMVDKYLNQIGLDTKIYSVHKLRHTAATLMYQHGNVDIRALQEILGHESVSTTQIYTHIDRERLRTAIDSNPLSNKTP